MKQYERTCAIERAEDGAEAGMISGILATDGEASDGHILNIEGMKVPARAPLLFGHDANSGTGNLGSWTGFSKFGTGKKLGDHGLRGSAQIELDGEGAQADWRGDVAMMVAKGHIGAFSVRWEELEEPVYRINLPSDHKAFVDDKKVTDRKRWGLYFEKSQLLEGSVVTLGADPAALVGRLMAAEGDARTFWRDAINASMTERAEVAPDLVAIHVGPHAGRDEHVYVERTAYDAMLEEANARYALALDALENAIEIREAADGIRDHAFTIRDEVDDKLTEALNFRSTVEPAAGDEPPKRVAEERDDDDDAGTLPAHIESPKEIIALVRSELRQASSEVAAEAIGAIRDARGKVKE